MADMLTIGTNATNTFKRALDVTSHNVANIGTEGYNRQRAEILSDAPGNASVGFHGGGSRIGTVQRMYADFIQSQLVDANSQRSRYSEQLSVAKQLEGVVAGNDAGIQDFMQRLFDSFHNLANNPTSSTARQQVISESNNMESMLSNMSGVLSETQIQTNAQIENIVLQVNEQLTSIQAINQEVANSTNYGGQPPNDLLDQRDEAIKQFGALMDIKTFKQPDGRIEIYTADGRYPLLNDNVRTNLSASYSDYKNEQKMEVYIDLSGNQKMISDSVQGGQLGGLLDFRNNMLDKSMNELGVALNGLVASVNWQHYQGFDLNGDPGQDFYQPLTVNANERLTNTGVEDGTNIKVSFNPLYNPSTPVQGTNPPFDPAAVAPAANAQPPTYGDKQTNFQTAMAEIGNFKAREYELTFIAVSNSYEVRDYKTGEVLNDAAGNPISVSLGAPDNGVKNIDGLQFDFSVALVPDDGDQFIVKPHQEILNNFNTILDAPEKLASRGQSSQDTNNDGVLTDEVPAAAAYGDNVNMANIASLQSKKILYSDQNGNPSETILGGYSKMATNVGMYVSGTQIQLTAQENVFNQVNDRREAYSGVNLDEEAANLLRFQQAYQASAQIIQTSQSLFQSLLGAVRL
ncbi:flagellar hook-associated protein FlgK [Hydrogenovibrio sp. SC-1]|uniref:flagellar hook-associated protein FlgK n=1 Tax=Hydrogenovibrio sp. SC-1 TaxID=2065820 RepID=UPI000C7CBE37|nr:flagellar hook-associated protein FlgK [Hydrogenovibrio sp. SC-1]PLA74882.1 flagellar hook-associated protein FlgK [Hydrogenovibrio sp. SC-1]